MRLILLVAVLAGCEHRTTAIPLELRGPPFPQMRTVELGMTREQLAEYRQLRPVSDTRYEESLGQFMALYDFVEGRLFAITVPETDQPGTDGMRRFETYRQQSNIAFDVVPECRVLSAAEARLISYPLTDAVFEISYRPADDTGRTVVTRSYRLQPSSDWQSASPQPCAR